MFLKQEQLSKQKVETEDIRAIYVPPDPFARCQARFDQCLNTALKKRNIDNGIAVGMNPFKDVPAIVHKLGNANYFVERDWKRFDGTITASVMYEIRWLRWLNLKPHYRTKENWNVYSTITANLVDKHLVHPTGEVYRVRKGNPSGQMSTSTDNCLFNLFISAYIHFHCYGSPPYSLLTYGDDTLAGYKQVPDVEREEEVARRHFGMSLPKEKVIVQTTPVGLTFCGFEIAERDGRYYPVYRPEKIIANIWRPVNVKRTRETLWAQLVSATLLLWGGLNWKITYDLLRYHFDDDPNYPVPDPNFFNSIFWMDGGVDQNYAFECREETLHVTYQNGRCKEEGATGSSQPPSPGSSP